MEHAMKIHNVIIIGSGPAGYTAGIYTARANLKPLLFEGYMTGGQLMTTTDVENFPGYPDGVMGPDLMQDLKKQAGRFGTEMIAQDVDAIDFSKRPFQITSAGQDYLAQSVIIATGATAQYMGLESEKRLIGKGVSACATCDGAFFKDEKVIVVGGGDSAIEEAIFLTRFASSVTVVHRRDKLRASKIMQDKAFQNKKIIFYWDTVVTECLGKNKLEAVKLKNVKTGEERVEEFSGYFVAIGHKPATDLFKTHLELDEQGYIVTKDKRTQTSLEGVFACGDVQDRHYRQAITAAGSGCAAAIDCEKWLESNT